MPNLYNKTHKASSSIDHFFKKKGKIVCKVRPKKEQLKRELLTLVETSQFLQKDIDYQRDHVLKDDAKAIYFESTQQSKIAERIKILHNSIFNDYAKINSIDDEIDRLQKQKLVILDSIKEKDHKLETENMVADDAYESVMFAKRVLEIDKSQIISMQWKLQNIIDDIRQMSSAIEKMSE